MGLSGQVTGEDVLHPDDCVLKISALLRYRQFSYIVHVELTHKHNVHENGYGVNDLCKPSHEVLSFNGIAFVHCCYAVSEFLQSIIHLRRFEYPCITHIFMPNCQFLSPRRYFINLLIPIFHYLLLCSSVSNTYVGYALYEYFIKSVNINNVTLTNSSIMSWPCKS